jgi:hypothetical protein
MVMSTNAEQPQARSGKRRRKRAAAERRRRDLALAPVVVAQRLGIRVEELARAMLAAGVEQQLTEAQALGWIADPRTAPEWLTTLLGQRLARAAEQELRRRQIEERRQMRELATEASALAKVTAGNRRFSDDEWEYVNDWAFQAAKDLVRGDPHGEVDDFDRQVLLAVGVDADDHSTWPVHAGGCDGYGEEHCVVRMEQVRAARRVEALIESVAKETRLGELHLTPGQFVTTWHGARVGLVVKVNKVSVKVRMIGGRNDRNSVVEKNLDPRYVEVAPAGLPSPPEPGDEVVVRDYGGHSRHVRVIEVDGPLFEATYSLKSGQWRSGWFDLAAIPRPSAPQ